LLEGRTVIYQPQGKAKMSQVIIDYIEPYLDSVDTYIEYDNLVGFAVLVWNIALLPQNEQKKFISEILGNFSQTDALKLKPILEELLRRKKNHFADNKRFIVEYDLTESNDGFHLFVVSTLKK
jgi:hypothetical protein